MQWYSYKPRSSEDSAAVLRPLVCGTFCSGSKTQIHRMCLSNLGVEATGAWLQGRLGAPHRYPAAPREPACSSQCCSEVNIPHGEASSVCMSDVGRTGGGLREPR